MLKLVVFLLFTFSLSLRAEVLRLGAANWCPYTCPKEANKGYVSKLVKDILATKGIKLEISFLPWKRAVQEAKTGKLDGLLTADLNEAPELLFTTTPTDSYRSCFFTLKENDMDFDIKKLSHYKVGFADGYAYGPVIDKFLKDNKKSQNLTSIGGENTLNRLFKMNKLKRIDFFLEDENVALYKYGNLVTSKYCDKEKPFFLALNKDYKGKDKIINFLNKALRENSPKHEILHKGLLKLSE